MTVCGKAADEAGNIKLTAFDVGALPATGRITAGKISGGSSGTGGTLEGEKGNVLNSAKYAHVEGSECTAGADYTHVEGWKCKANGKSAHAEGTRCEVTGSNAHSEGSNTHATGGSAHSEGHTTYATGAGAHSEGVGTNATNYASHAQGKFNKSMTGGDDASTIIGDAMVVGNGTSTSALSNAFRVTYAGAAYGLSAFNSTGADYAEYFEWADGNPEGEDRVGYFVTLDGKHIRRAEPGEYILGVVSGQPCIIGNADEDWMGRWEHDPFGRFVREEVEEPVTEEREVLDEEGNPTGELEEVPTGETVRGWRYKANPAYDPEQRYVERKDRPEWSAVGMLGVLSVRDDGTCQPNGYCRVAEGGIATAAEGYRPGETWRVIERVTENVVKIVFR